MRNTHDEEQSSFILDPIVPPSCLGQRSTEEIDRKERGTARGETKDVCWINFQDARKQVKLDAGSASTYVPTQ